MLSNEVTLRKIPSPAMSESESWPISELGARTTADWHTEANERSYQIRLGPRIVRIETTTAELPKWLLGVVAELNKIADLPSNWDSYDALPVPQRTLEHALQVIAQLMDIDTLPPQVGATVDGGVEFEWHRNGMDLEVQILAPFQVHMYFFDEELNEEREESIGANLEVIRPYLGRLTK